MRQKIKKQHITYAIFFALVLLASVACNTEASNWDYYLEVPHRTTLSDVGGIALATSISDYPNDIIAEAVFEVYVKHDAPNTLDIDFFYNDDSFSVWTDDFPVGRVEFRIDSLIGCPVNAGYAIDVDDPYEDGNNGKFISFTIKLNFMDY